MICVSFVAQVAKGMHAMHSCLPSPIVHRDIKLSNIVLDHNNVAKICDFGLAIILKDHMSAYSFSIVLLHLQEELVLSAQWLR